MTLRVLDQRGSEVKPHRVISVFQTALKENFKTISPASLSLKPALELAQRRLFKGPANPQSVRRFSQRTIFSGLGFGAIHQS